MPPSSFPSTRFQDSNMRVLQSLQRGALVLAVLFLSACGGSDSSDTAPVNPPPSASIKLSPSVPTGAVVTLDGSGSNSPEGRALTYSWVLTAVPAGSVATIINPTTVQPTIVVDVAGTYGVALTVSDGAQSARVTNAIGAITSTQAIISDIVEPLSGAVQLGFAFDPGITTVTWTVDGTTLGSGAITQAWDTTTVANGNHTVLAHLAFTNNNYTLDVSRTFAVAQTTVTFTGSSATESLGALTAIAGAASPNGIIRMDAALDGVAFGTLAAPNACLDPTGAACASTGPNGYQFTGTVTGGNHTITFTATDGVGHSLGTQVRIAVSDVT
jgi:hypothetical protein